jgi:hypothetical protein
MPSPLRTRIIAPAALCFAALAGCSDFMNSPAAVVDPNTPASSSRDQLFVGASSNVFANEEGPVAMLICEWMQQCAGVNGGFVQRYGTYDITSATFDAQFRGVYQGGGLVALRAVQLDAATAGDEVYQGIAEVLEAMNMLYAADVWGDVPYAQTASGTTATFDPQMQVYEGLLALLNSAIAHMNGTGVGPGAADLVYGGDKSRWIEAAHTLKARIHLHRVEKLGAGEYASALAEARQGIQRGHDWLTNHTASPFERNLWAQFQRTANGADLVAGASLVKLMNARDDDRRREYFGLAKGGGYVGYDVVTQLPAADQVSPIGGSVRTNNVSFRQPVLTWNENQLIIAEAALQTGDPATAAAAYNAVVFDLGRPEVAASALTLAEVMTEKYIVLFQNREVWNDFKRTCLPVLHPAKGKLVIPGRVYYGATEEATNPNAPASAAQDLFIVRNSNDPLTCRP